MSVYWIRTASLSLDDQLHSVVITAAITIALVIMVSCITAWCCISLCLTPSQQSGKVLASLLFEEEAVVVMKTRWLLYWLLSCQDLRVVAG